MDTLYLGIWTFRVGMVGKPSNRELGSLQAGPKEFSSRDPSSLQAKTLEFL